MPIVSIRLLGAFGIQVDGAPPRALPSRKAQALLAYLALPPGRPHARDQLAALLWGSVSDARARTSLRQALTAIRRALQPANPLRSEAETVTLEADAVDVDAVSLECAVRHGTPEALARMADLYGGDLLLGIGVGEAPFEEWLTTQRERLRDLALEGLARLLSRQQQEGTAESAIETGRRLLAIDPLQEAVHRELMRLHVRLGRRGPALRQYQMCVDVLQRELGTEPDAETRRLYQSIVRGGAPGAPGRDARPGGDRTREKRSGAAWPLPGLASSDLAGVPRLVGRRAEMAALVAALDGAWRGRGRLLLVLGEAGVGKSRLTAELAAEAARRGALLMAGNAHESEQSLTFGPWADAWRRVVVDGEPEALADLPQHCREGLESLVPEMAAQAPPNWRIPERHLVDAVIQGLEHVAELAPVLLVLEDVHWADEGSLRLLAIAARRLARARVLVVATAREEDGLEAAGFRVLLEELDRGRHDRLRLSPLGPDATAELVGTLAPPGLAASARHALAARVWTISRGHPLLVVETMRGLQDGPPGQIPTGILLPARVQVIVERRLHRLSEAARSLLSVAAVAGRASEFRLLGTVAQLPEEEAAAALDELVRRRLLREEGGRFGFSHAWVREVIHASIVPIRRQILHRQLAEALEGLVGDSDVLARARHYQAAEVWDRAALAFRAAGVRALGRAAAREASGCFNAALAALGRLPESQATREMAIDLHIDQRLALGALGEIEPALDWLDKARRLAEAIGDERRLARVAAEMCHYLDYLGDPARAIQTGQQALATAAHIGDPTLEMQVSFHLARALVSAARFEEAERGFHRALDFIPKVGAAARAALPFVPAVACRVWIGLCRAFRGDLVTAVAGAEDALERAVQEAHPFTTALAWLGLGWVRMLAYRLSEAGDALERALDLSRELEASAMHPGIATILGWSLTERGRADEALPLLVEAVERAAAIRQHYVEPGALAILAAAQLGLGHGVQARAAAERGLALARTYGQRWTEVEALLVRGAVAAGEVPPDLPAAETHTREAFTLAEALTIRPAMVRADLQLGRILRAAGRPTEGAEALARARALASRLGMVLSELPVQLGTRELAGA